MICKHLRNCWLTTIMSCIHFKGMGVNIACVQILKVLQNKSSWKRLRTMYTMDSWNPQNALHPDSVGIRIV